MSNMDNMVDMEKSQTAKSEIETIGIDTKNIGLKEQFLAKKFRRSQSYDTKHLYGLTIDKLTEFLRTKYNLDLDQIIHAIKAEKLSALDILDNFYTFLTEYRRNSGKIGYPNSSIRTYVTVVKEFLNSNGIRLFNEEVRQRLSLPQKQDVYEEGLSKEIINRVLRVSGLKLATAILIACSGGMRLGEIIQLKLSDVDFDTNPTTIQVRKETTKTHSTRFIHITNEATVSLKDYLAKTFSWKESNKTDRYIFLLLHEEKILKYKAQLQDPNIEKQRPHLLRKYISKLENELQTLSKEELYHRAVITAKASFEEMIRNVIESIPDLAVKIKDNDRNQIHFHAFRAWFKTQVTDAHQSDFAEALMGHKNLKTLYYRQNHEKRQKVYREIEHALTISDTEVIEKNLSQIQDSEKELTELVKEMRQEHKEEIRTLRNWVTQVISGYQAAKSP